LGSHTRDAIVCGGPVLGPTVVVTVRRLISGGLGVLKVMASSEAGAVVNARFVPT